MFTLYKKTFLKIVSTPKSFFSLVFLLISIPLLALYLSFLSTNFVAVCYLLSSFILCFLIFLRESSVKTICKKLQEEEKRRSNPMSMEQQKEEALQRSLEENTLLQNHINNLSKHYSDQINPIQKSLIKTKESNHFLSLELYKKSEENQELHLHLDSIIKAKDLAEENFQQSVKIFEEETRHKELLVNEYRKTTYEQRSLLEKKQAYITKLESKIRDLMYEIRSLLQLEEMDKDNFLAPTSSKEEILDYYIPSERGDMSSFFSEKLDSFISKAEGFTGENYLSSEGKIPRFLDIPLNNRSIECRQLFDILKDDNTGIIFIYSKEERKMLFVNNLFKTILGWPLEKFLKEYPHIMQNGYKNLISALDSDKTDRNPYQGEIMIKDRQGQTSNFHYFLKSILQGPLNHHSVGILYPYKKKT
ncbi:hypothetical protein [Candidatus Clavichlamydia salmonicola]|uniref:hypothetical protein n=1 Tax=Candidatus Clavichlamydia salmonicola TaxID=469812 RepID=UPI001890B7FF|nr:hypothetical protein [Candidatus Clavichlamydia salmonicola]